LPRIIIYIKNSFPDPDPAQNFDADADPDGGEGVGQPKMYIPPGKILGTALSVSSKIYRLFTIFTEVRRNHKNVNTYLLANRVSSIERSSPHCMARLHASLKSSNTSLKRCTEFEHLAGSTLEFSVMDPDPHGSGSASGQKLSSRSASGSISNKNSNPDPHHVEKPKPDPDSECESGSTDLIESGSNTYG
jgi:hypothetical protein